jgi:hypothetical protein
VGERRISVTRNGDQWVVRQGGRILARFTGPAARQAAEQFADNLESAAQVQAAFEQNREKILSSLRGGQSVTR